MLDGGAEVCAIFFDLKKAFDSVPNRPLVNKLQDMGLNDHLVRWISDYLTDRNLWSLMVHHPSLQFP